MRTNSRASIPTTNLEQDSSDAPLAEKEAPRLNSLYDLHVRSVRKRLADPDGLSAKAVIDGLVHAGILADDSAKYIREVSFSQEKGEPEKTVMVFYVA